MPKTQKHNVYISEISVCLFFKHLAKHTIDGKQLLLLSAEKMGSQKMFLFIPLINKNVYSLLAFSSEKQRINKVNIRWNIRKSNKLFRTLIFHREIKAISQSRFRIRLKEAKKYYRVFELQAMCENQKLTFFFYLYLVIRK